MMDYQTGMIIGVLLGMGATFLLMRTYCHNLHEDRHAEAYERGWTDGYDIGVKQSAPAKTRTKKIRKADQ